MKQHMKPFHNPISESAPSPSTNQYDKLLIFFHSILRYDRISPIISHIFLCVSHDFPILSRDFPIVYRGGSHPAMFDDTDLTGG